MAKRARESGPAERGGNRRSSTRSAAVVSPSAPAPDPVKARTALQEAFAVEYCVDHNATAAYKRAKGGNVGTAAKKVASELLHLPQVQARIAELESAHLGDAKRRKEIRIGALLRTALDPDEGTANRLRAIELSGKIDGDFTERLEIIDPAGRADRLNRARKRATAPV